MCIRLFCVNPTLEPNANTNEHLERVWLQVFEDSGEDKHVVVGIWISLQWRTVFMNSIWVSGTDKHLWVTDSLLVAPPFSPLLQLNQTFSPKYLLLLFIPYFLLRKHDEKGVRFSVQLRMLPWRFAQKASRLIGPTLWSLVVITMTTIPTVPSRLAPLGSVNFPARSKWASRCSWPAAKFYKVRSPDAGEERGPAPGINHRRRRTRAPRRSMLNDAWSLGNKRSCWQSRTAVFISAMVRCI